VKHSEIVVDSIRPLYGPLSGGTRVTITGQYVAVSTISVVLISTSTISPDTNRFLFFTYALNKQFNILLTSHLQTQ